MNHLHVSLLLALTGCCYMKGGTTEVITIGTGRRTITCEEGKAVVTHSEIPETLRASGELLGEAAKAAGYGGPMATVPLNTPTVTVPIPDEAFDPTIVRPIPWKDPSKRRRQGQGGAGE